MSWRMQARQGEATWQEPHGLVGSVCLISVVSYHWGLLLKERVELLTRTFQKPLAF